MNFTAFSAPDTGGWIFLAAGILAIATLVFELYASRKKIAPLAGQIDGSQFAKLL